MRKLQNYVAKYGPEVGPRFYHLLQSQAAHASVSARLRKKIEAIRGRPAVTESVVKAEADSMPLFSRPSAIDGAAPCPIADLPAVG
ncbi:hypothetical protein TA3x_004617 [Tundrisphaera sp. TA3]|uniref:hypothetical protein n=1 Tax=Tundrisphaera sp. TA3 TaxID=3435775 RepID=UPI003EB9F938